MIKSSLFKFSRHSWWVVGIIVALALLTIGWFAFFPYRTFMGDDLGAILSAQTGFSASHLVDAFTSVGADRYRPVTAVFFQLESLAVGSDFRSYMYFNIIFEFLNACLVAYICYRLSRKQLFVAFIAGVMFIISRFAYYYVLQVLGGCLEGLALCLFLLLVITTLHAYETRKPISLVWPLLFYLWVIFTHERYVVVGAFLVMAILLSPVNFKANWHRYIFAGFPIAIMLFNYSLKTFIFRSNFFSGAGAKPIQFDFLQFINFMLNGAGNMLGFNQGPDYLSGLDVVNAGITGILLGSILTASLTALFIAYIVCQFHPTRRFNKYELRNIILFLALFIPLLASASITFRQEYRWLYTPYVAVIFGVAYMSGRISPTGWIRFLLIICILISAVGVDTYYRGYLNNVYFINGLRVADSAKETIIDKYGSKLSQKQVFLVGAGGDIKNWYFQDATFFKFYTGDPEIQVRYIDSFEEIKNYRLDIDNTLVFSYDHTKREFVDITDKARAALVNRPALLKEPSFDFLVNYQYGKINSMQQVSTPTGYGVFTMSWPDDIEPENTITIISGFSYTYDKVLIKEGDILSFAAGIPYEISDGALAYVDVETVTGERRRLFKADLLPATKAGIKWELFLIPCTDYEGQEVSITFGVESPSGYPTADWIAFSSPMLGIYR